MLPPLSPFPVSGFAFYIDSYCPSAEEYLSLSAAAALFTSLALNAAKSSIFFGCIKRHPKAWWSAELKERLVKDTRLLRPLTEVMKIARLTSPLLDAPRQSSPRPRLRHGRQLALLSPESNPKSVYSFFHSVTGSSSSSSSSSNLPNCSSPRESALVYAAYLRSHFSVSQPKTLRSRVRDYLSELRRATCPEESHSSFCSPFSLAEFLAAASNLSSSTATGSDKFAYPLLKHLPRSGMDFLLYIFNLS